MKRRVITSTILLSLIFFNAFARHQPVVVYSFGIKVSGKGKPMILIPGKTGSPDTYNDVVAHYASHYKCYVITLAGYAGQPPSEAHDHLLLKQRDDIIRYIINEHLHKPVLVGFSFGAELALWIACTKPELIGPIIDLDGTAFDAALGSTNFNKDSLNKADSIKYTFALARSPQFWHKHDSAYHSLAAEKSAFVFLQTLVTDTNRVKDIMRWDEASNFKSMVLMDIEGDTIDLRQQVAKLTSPILVLGSWRSWDIYKTKEEAQKDYEKSFAQAKNVTVSVSENGKHFLMYDDFAWMINHMDAFLLKYQ